MRLVLYSDFKGRDNPPKLFALTSKTIKKIRFGRISLDRIVYLSMRENSTLWLDNNNANNNLVELSGIHRLVYILILFQLEKIVNN